MWVTYFHCHLLSSQLWIAGTQHGKSSQRRARWLSSVKVANPDSNESLAAWLYRRTKSCSICTHAHTHTNESTVDSFRGSNSCRGLLSTHTSRPLTGSEAPTVAEACYLHTQADRWQVPRLQQLPRLAIHTHKQTIDRFRGSNSKQTVDRFRGSNSCRGLLSTHTSRPLTGSEAPTVAEACYLHKQSDRRQVPRLQQLPMLTIYTHTSRP